MSAFMAGLRGASSDRRLGDGRRGGRDHADALLVARLVGELDGAVGRREERVVAPHPDVRARVEFAAAAGLLVCHLPTPPPWPWACALHAASRRASPREPMQRPQPPAPMPSASLVARVASAPPPRREPPPRPPRRPHRPPARPWLASGTSS